MKIIDLLNKIANGEEVPKVIRFLNYKYIFDTFDKEYQRYQNGVCYGFGEDRRLDIILDDEVEIIEEENKIPEKLSTWFSVEAKQSKELNIEYANTNFENMYEKINEIIDYLDYLKSKGDE